MTTTPGAPMPAGAVGLRPAIGETVAASAGPFPDGAPDFWFDLPLGFSEFDLDEDSEDRMLRTAEAIDPLFADATPVQKFSLVLSGEYALHTMLKAGAEHISTCMYRMTDGKLSQGTLAVFIERPTVGPEVQDRTGSARRTAEQWHALYPDAEAAVVMLPYGPSALCIRDQDLMLPGALCGLDESVPTTIRFVEVCVPLRTGPGSALFLFMTEDREHWDDYLQILSGIMKSVSADEIPGDEVPEVPRGEGATRRHER
ncbi:hypothetical protein AB0H77_01755 [Streptomyces sp. NPDC050844]|uniref:hypothetical protein n=1 Tax=Streptomyces sp. NPDC050844 TaxID=3155790 RepID=UPI0033E0D7ED